MVGSAKPSPTLQMEKFLDPTLLTTLVSLGVSVVTVLVHQYLTAASPTTVSGASAAATSAPATPTTAADPFAGLPGLPGHPLLNGLIGPWLNGMLGGQSTATTSEGPQSAVATSANEQAAIAALAQIIKGSPTATAQMKAALGT